MKRGIVIIAMSKPAAVMANSTIYYLNKFGENIFPITVITDQPRLICQWKNTSVSTYRGMDAHSIKTQGFNISPYDETMILDVDLFFIKKCSEVWNYLDNSDLAMCVDYRPTVEKCNHILGEEKDYTLSIVPGNFIQYNTGILLFRKTNNIKELFKNWFNEWCKFKKFDQLALARALYFYPQKITSIPYKFNTMIFKETEMSDEYIGIHLVDLFDELLILKNIL